MKFTGNLHSGRALLFPYWRRSSLLLLVHTLRAPRTSLSILEHGSSTWRNRRMIPDRRR